MTSGAKGQKSSWKVWKQLGEKSDANLQKARDR